MIPLHGRELRTCVDAGTPRNTRTLRTSPHAKALLCLVLPDPTHGSGSMLYDYGDDSVLGPEGTKYALHRRM